MQHDIRVHALRWLVLAFALLTAAFGQKGDLYLPDRKAEAAVVIAG